MSDSEIAIRVQNISKRYRIGLEEERHDTLASTIASYIRRPGKNLQRLRHLTRFGEDDSEAADIIWALKDISFEVKRGEVLGIIGRNGAGKSTLLKVLSRITYPTSGRFELRGRVSSLLEVGTGFHPELTGRENIYLNGTILGMRKAEIDRKFDEIVDFSDVEKFIDTPVKRYSSGMRVRLAFSVAAHLEPEILLVDEVLAVGDAEFQKKCLGKMGTVAQEGRTILFVSHQMAAVQSLCPTAILLRAGTIAKMGSTNQVIYEYLSIRNNLAETSLASRPDRKGTGQFKFTSIKFLGHKGRALDSISAGQAVDIALDYESHGKIAARALRVSIGFRDRLDRFLFNCPSDVVTSLNGDLPSEGTLVCTLPRFPLPEGEYQYNLFSSLSQEITDWIQDAGTLQVHGGDFYGTGKLPPQSHRGVLVDFKWKLG